MKKKIVVSAILGVMSGAAFAQSSVTIYGTVDAGLTASRGVAGDDGQKHSRIGLDSGLLDDSRIGFRGNEDLGGGTSAIFNLEAGFNTNDGANTQGTGQLFGRRAIVGLENDNLGKVELGKQDSVLDDTVRSFDAYGNANATAAGNIIRYDDRISNSIAYTTPDYAGFTAKANYGFGEKAGSASAGRFYGLSLNYNNDAFAASLAAAHSDYTNKTTTGTDVTNDSSVYDTANFFGDASKRNLYVLGASYDFGVVKPYALLSYGKTDVAATNYDSVKDKGAVLGVSVPFGASTVLASAGYVNVKPNGQSSGNAQQYTVGYTYDFSKRTSLYATYDYIKNSDGLKNTNISYSTVTGGNQVFGVGIQHQF